MTASDEKRREANVSVKIKRKRLILFRETGSSNTNLKTVMAPKRIREGSFVFVFFHICSLSTCSNSLFKPQPQAAFLHWMAFRQPVTFKQGRFKIDTAKPGLLCVLFHAIVIIIKIKKLNLHSSRCYLIFSSDLS